MTIDIRMPAASTADTDQGEEAGQGAGLATSQPAPDLIEDLKAGRLVVVPPVSVKPLEWRDARIADKWPRMEAETVLGRYEALEWSNGRFGGSMPSLEPHEVNVEFFADTLEAAQAAAQADYEARILSALAASPGHTTDLLALVEGMACDPDGCKAHIDAFMARALAAEAERDEARQLAYDLKYAAAGGEDAPGSAHAVTVADVDRWRREQWDVASTDRTMRVSAEARALAAEAKVEALREALAPFGSGAVVFYENEPDDCVLSLGRWKYQEDGRARFYADVQFTVADVRRARALTQEQPDV